jgi:hypothetical protein
MKVIAGVDYAQMRAPETKLAVLHWQSHDVLGDQAKSFAVA